jgi:hypothetical protein
MEWDEQIAENLVILESQFWDHIQNVIAPEVDGSDATESALSARYPRHEDGKGVEGGQELGQIWDDFQTAKENAAKAEAEQKALRSRILEIIGNAEFATVNGETILTYKTSKDSEALDADRLKKEAPEIWDTYKKVKPGFRTLRAVKS